MQADTSSQPARHWPLTRRTVGLGLLLLLSLGAALAAVLWNDWRVRYRSGEAKAAAIASGAERDLHRDLDYLERILAGLAADARQVTRTAPERAPQLLTSRIAEISRRNPDLSDIHFSRSLPVQAGLRTTGGSGVRMRIGHPRKHGGMGWVVPLALPIAGASAGEAAWLLATLRLGALERIASPMDLDLDLGNNGVAAIIHRDGVMMARSSDQARWVGTSLQHSALFRQHLPSASTGTVEMTSELDNQTRIAAYRVLPDYPLLVVAAISRAEAVRGWTRFALTASVLGGLLMLLWLALLRVWLRARREQERLSESLRRGAAELQEMRRIASIGSWNWNVDTGLVNWSEEIYLMQGLPPRTGAFHIDDIPQRIHPQDSERRKQDIAELVAGDGPAEIQYRILRADGAVRTIRARGEWTDRTPGKRMLSGIQQDITELAETRERLRAAQDDYRFLFEHNPLPMFVFDRETLAFLAVNDAMLKKYGYTREELLAMSMLAIRPPEDADAFRAAARLQTSEGSQGTVWNHLRKDGSRMRVAIHNRDIELNARPARLVMALDVTEQERNEQRLQLIARATTDAVWDWDFEAGTTWRSDNVYPLFGYATGEFAPSLAAWEALLHVDDRARVLNSLQHAIDSDASEWEERYRFRRKDDSYALVHDRGFILRDERGRALRAVGGMVDVTEKQRHETDLRLLRRAVESTENGVSISDARLPDMPLVYVNAAFERITGYSAQEVLGRNCRFLQGGERDQLGRHEIRRGLDEARETRAVLRNYRKDGTPFWNDLHVNPVRDDSGAITHFVGVQYDVTERLRQQEYITHLATHDELTGLPNRTLLHDRLQQAIAAAARFKRGVGVLHLGLDNFKLINDSLGHSMGDMTLRAVAGRLATCVRDADTVGRVGGDEFVLLISEQADGSGMARVIERIETAFSSPLEVSGIQHYLTCSIGHCSYPQDGDGADTLLMHADIAMYQAKQLGRNRAIEYRSEFDAMASERLHLISRLREALLHEEFVLHFQPLFRADGAPSGLEALVRWQHPELGLLPPGRFIDACESSGLIVPLGRWVLREAARHHALLAARGLGHLAISVNVSALQFQPDLLDEVQDVIALHQLPRGALEIELTESAVMGDPEVAIAIMKRLNAFGVSIAVDDFGTGYSSLAYLKRLPISRLKIDRSFVRDLGREDDKAICTSIITLARSLHLRTVAEGVETDLQREWLVAQGCDELQGFLLARPAAFESILRLLAPEQVTDQS